MAARLWLGLASELHIRFAEERAGKTCTGARRTVHLLLESQRSQTRRARRPAEGRLCAGGAPGPSKLSGSWETGCVMPQKDWDVFATDLTNHVRSHWPALDRGAVLMPCVDE